MRVGAGDYAFWLRSQEEFGVPFEAALERMAEVVAEAGCDGFELSRQFCGTPEAVRRVHALLDATGLALPSVYSYGPLHDERQAETIRNTVEESRRLRELGADLVVFNVDMLWDRSKTDAELAAEVSGLEELGATLAAGGQRLALHFHLPELQDGARELRACLDGTDPRHVGLCLDADWAWRGGIDPTELLSLYGDRLLRVDLRDSAGGKWVQALGEGDYDYRPLAAWFAGDHADIWLKIELATEEGTRWDRSLLENHRRSRGWVRETFGR